MKGEILEDALALDFHNVSLMVHEVIDRQVLFKGIVDTVEAALLEPRKIKRGFPKCLAWNGTGVDAASADIRRPFDDGYAFAKISRLRSGLFPGRAAADHDQ